MTKDDLKLLEEFIDAKLERLLAATRVAMMDLDGHAIMTLMQPIEEKLEYLRQRLT